jgi:tetratricopeptide (TPR) repeat protein
LYSEARHWLSRLLADCSDVDARSREKALFAAGVLADAQGDYQASQELFERQLTICRELNDDWAVASALNNLAIAALRFGDVDGAAARQTETLRLWREFDNRPSIALTLQNLGNIERTRDSRDAARKSYRESADVFRDIGDTRGLAVSLTHLADLDRDEGQFASAIALYEDALQTFMALNDHGHVANCMADYGEACRRAGQYGEAHSLFEEALIICRELGDRKSGVRILESVALLALDERLPVRALELAGAAATLRSQLGISGALPELESSLGRARADAGRDADAAWERGQHMLFEDAVDHAQTA